MSRIRKKLLRSLHPTDVLLASYPRSGNTWLRFILADLLVDGREAYPTDIEELNRIIYDIYKGMGDARFIPFRLVKIHESHFGTPHRFVGLVRRPTDAIVSYFHYHRLHKHLLDRTKDGVDEFVRQTAPIWIENVQSYVDAIDNGRPGTLITYEGLHGDPQETVSAVCRFIGINTTEQNIGEAIRRRAFRNLQEAESAGPLHPTQGPPAIASERFFRKGRIGSGAAELTDASIELIATTAQPVYEDAARRAIDTNRAR